MTCASVEATRQWYKRVFGFEINRNGSVEFKHSRMPSKMSKFARTIWAPFDKNGDPFSPSLSEFMISLIVDDIDDVVSKAEKAGAKQCSPRATFDYGRFAWFLDPDGRKVELWEPILPFE